MKNQQSVKRKLKLPVLNTGNAVCAQNLTRHLYRDTDLNQKWCLDTVSVKLVYAMLPGLPPYILPTLRLWAFLFGKGILFLCSAKKSLMKPWNPELKWETISQSACPFSFYPCARLEREQEVSENYDRTSYHLSSASLCQRRFLQSRFQLKMMLAAFLTGSRYVWNSSKFSAWRSTDIAAG